MAATVPPPKVAKTHVIRRKSNSTSFPDNCIGASDAESSGNFKTKLSNGGITYYVNVEVGTPGQQVSLEVDTGSSDTYVQVTGNKACSDAQSCKGVFDPSESSTWKTNSSDPFYIGYNDGSYAKGKWGTDDLSIAGNTVTNLSIGLNSEGTMTNGLLGVSFPEDEETYSLDGEDSPFMYENYPLKLKSDGIIDRVAYSLYLNSQNLDSGTLMFGGVDKSKYTGPLYTVPFVKEPFDKTNYRELLISTKSISVSGGNDEVDLGANAVLDSGTTYLWGPPKYTDKIAGRFGGQKSGDVYSVDCPKLNDSSDFEFDFGGFQIKNPVSDYVYKDQGQCYLKLVGSNSDEWILRDVFLQHAYVVYDLEGKQAAIAQADYSNSSEDIELSQVPLLFHQIKIE